MLSMEAHREDAQEGPSQVAAAARLALHLAYLALSSERDPWQRYGITSYRASQLSQALCGGPRGR